MKNGLSDNVNTLCDNPQVSTSKRLARPPLGSGVSLLSDGGSFLRSAIPESFRASVRVAPRRVRAAEPLNTGYAVHAATSLHRVKTVKTLSFHSSYFLIVPFRVTVSPSSKERVPVSHLNLWPSPVKVLA